MYRLVIFSGVDVYCQLSAMIEADMNCPPGIPAEEGTGQQVISSEYMLQRRKSFISFDVFRHEYWAHFPQSLTKGLGPLHFRSLEAALIAPSFVQTSLSCSANSWVKITLRTHAAHRC
jgi:hypothetical protein